MVDEKVGTEENVVEIMPDLSGGVAVDQEKQEQQRAEEEQVGAEAREAKAEVGAEEEVGEKGVVGEEEAVAGEEEGGVDWEQAYRKLSDHFLDSGGVAPALIPTESKPVEAQVAKPVAPLEFATQEEAEAIQAGNVEVLNTVMTRAFQVMREASMGEVAPLVAQTVDRRVGMSMYAENYFRQNEDLHPLRAQVALEVQVFEGSGLSFPEKLHKAGEKVRGDVIRSSAIAKSRKGKTRAAPAFVSKTGVKPPVQEKKTQLQQEMDALAKYAPGTSTGKMF